MADKYKNLPNLPELSGPMSAAVYHAVENGYYIAWDRNPTCMALSRRGYFMHDNIALQYWHPTDKAKKAVEAMRKEGGWAMSYRLPIEDIPIIKPAACGKTDKGSSPMTGYYIAWNADKSEGFITDNPTEAKLAGGHYDEDDLEGMGELAVSKAAMYFGAVYEGDGPLEIQKVSGFLHVPGLAAIDPERPCPELTADAILKATWGRHFPPKPTDPSGDDEEQGHAK